MTVRATEKFLPAGGPHCLGQAFESGDYSLVSYLTSPIPLGLAIDYVVFAIKDAPADRYEWTFKPIPSGDITETTTEVGVTQYVPSHIGTLNVRVRILVGVDCAAELSLTQEIVEPTTYRFTLLDSIKGASMGHAPALLEVVHGFKSYILEAIREPEDDAKARVPAALLAAIVYAEAQRVPSKSLLDLAPGLSGSSRDREVALAAERLNGTPPTSADQLFTNALGVCQMLPQTLAMIAKPPDGHTPYTEWIEKPADEAGRRIKNAQILANYAQLTSAAKIELFNILRFPKAQIRWCAELLKKLKTRSSKRWPDLAADELLSQVNDFALRIIATEYKIGATDSPAPAVPSSPQPGEARTNSYGEKISNLLGAPFIFCHFGGHAEIAGVVTDQATGLPIPGTRVHLFRRVVKVSSPSGLPFYRQPVAGLTPIAALKANEIVAALTVRLNEPSGFDWIKIDTALGEAWINARSGTKRYSSTPFDQRVEQGVVTTDASGYYGFTVTRLQTYSIRAVKEDYYDAVSDQWIPPSALVHLEMQPARGCVNESEIISLLEKYEGYTYDLHDPYSPIKLWKQMMHLEEDGVQGLKQNNCSTFTAGILIGAWRNNRTPPWLDASNDQIEIVCDASSLSANTIRQYYYDWQIAVTSAANRFAVLDAAYRLGIADEEIIEVKAGDKAIPPIAAIPWSLAQGFNHDEDSAYWGAGHSFIIVERHQVNGDLNDDLILTLESTDNLETGASPPLKGPGFRGIGTLTSAGVVDFGPGKEWFLNGKVPTWAVIKSKWKHLRLVRLRIYDQQWVR